MFTNTILALWLIFNCVFICVGRQAYQTYIPVLNLGEVDLWDSPKCETALRPYRYRCERLYRQAVNRTLHMYRMDVSTESVKRAVCCGGWEVKHCVRRAAEQIEYCGHRVASLYAQLPNENHVKTDVLDKCSEYGEYSAICDYNIINHGNRSCNCNVILLFILIFAINISLQF